MALLLFWRAAQNGSRLQVRRSERKISVQAAENFPEGLFLFPLISRRIKKKGGRQMEWIQETGRIYAVGEDGKLLVEVTFPEKDGIAQLNHTL